MFSNRASSICALVVAPVSHVNMMLSNIQKLQQKKIIFKKLDPSQKSSKRMKGKYILES